MRLISSFKDYYDCIQGMGYDEYPVFVRESRQIEKDKPFRTNIRDREKKEKVSTILDVIDQLPCTQDFAEGGVVVFCGRAYPFYEYGGRCYYELDRLISAVKSVRHFENECNYAEAKSFLVRFEQKSKKGTRRYRWRRADLSRESWKRYVEETSFDVPTDTFRYFDSPIIATSFDTSVILEVNPMLKDYNFEQVKDPYTAWQEISMFLGNELANQKDPNPPIPDKLKAQAKGFDKFSFRRAPTKKK